MNSHGRDCGHAFHAIRGRPSKVSSSYSIQNPGPGDGLVVLPYLPEMVLSIRIYAVVALATIPLRQIARG